VIDDGPCDEYARVVPPPVRLGPRRDPHRERFPARPERMLAMSDVVMASVEDRARPDRLIAARTRGRAGASPPRLCEVA
jgi:hypothetical protein